MKAATRSSTLAAGAHDAFTAATAAAVGMGSTYRNAISILLPDALGLGLALLKRVLVLELGAHVGGMDLCMRLMK